MLIYRGQPMLAVRLQPIFDRSLAVIAYEALLHLPLNQGKTGFLITGLERHENPEYLLNIHKFVVNKSIRYYNIGYRPIWLNFSARILLYPGHIEAVLQLLKEQGIQLKNIGIEVTETFFVENIDYFVTCLESLKTEGITIVLDDFGDGYQSLSRYFAFPFDYVKIAGKFIKRSQTCQRAKDLLVKLIRVMQSSKTKVIAECIESANEFHILYHQGYDGFQGFWLNKPLMPVANEPTTVLELPEEIIEQLRMVKWPL